MFAVSALAAVTTPWLDYIFNLTDSLPGALYTVHEDGEMKKSELIAYHWHSGTTYPAGTTLIKRMTSVADDTVKRAGSASWMSDQYIGTAKSFSKAGVPLQLAQESVIGAEEYFVSTPNPNSPDSQYALTGSVKQTEVIGGAYEIF